MSERAIHSVITGLPRPLWRGRIHTYAFWAAIPSGAWLLVVADRPEARIGALLFAGSLAAVYGVSAAYHRLARTARAQRIMRRLDHSMIFLLIAGTYTPVGLLALPRQWSVPLLTAVWALAVFGIATKVWGTDAIMRIGNVLYLVMGWLAILALPGLLHYIPLPTMVLMLVGGLLYTIGAIIFLMKRPDPFPEVFGYHEVWHSFTVLAGISHFAMVALIVS